MLESQSNYLSPMNFMSCSREMLSPVSISPKSDYVLSHDISNWDIDIDSFIDYKTGQKTLFNVQYPSPLELNIFNGYPSPIDFGSYESTLLDPIDYLFEASPKQMQGSFHLPIPTREVTINPVVLENPREEKLLLSPSTSSNILSATPKTLMEKKVVKDPKSPTTKTRAEKKFPKTSPKTIPSGRFWVIIKEEGKTRYKCPSADCDKSYTRPHNLKSHYLSHTGELPFACTTCQRRFARRSDMIRHEANMHKTEKIEE